MPPPFSFNLVTEPWIPCETLTGERVDWGLRDVLGRSHELGAVHDESPLATAVLHRLLLVVLDRALLLSSRPDWLSLWRAEALPMEPVERYLERWRRRFDLFDAERPFMQVAGLEASITKEKGKPPDRMRAWRTVMETSNCGGHIELVAPEPPRSALRPAEAARALLVFQMFTNGGRINNEADSWKGGILRSGAVTIVRGATLRETLLLNLVPRAKRQEGDVPPWERGRDIARVVRAPSGPADLALWPSRRMTLFPIEGIEGPVVEEVLSAAGERMDEDVQDAQMTYFVRNPKNPPVTLRFDPDRSPWRDATALFDGSVDGPVLHRPEAIRQLVELIDDDVLPRASRFAVELCGMSTDKATIRLWRHERIPLPGRLLTDRALIAALREALTSGEDVGWGLDKQVLYVLCERAIAPGERDAHKDDIARLRDSLGTMTGYWAELGLAFEPWLLELAEADDPDGALVRWRKTVKRAARGAFDAAVAKLGTTARAYQAGAQAERTLRKLFRETLSDLEPTTDDAATARPETSNQEGAPS